MSEWTIYKYSVSPGTLDLLLPRGAQVLCVNIQYGSPQMWVLLDPTEHKVQRRFVTYGTGHSIPSGPPLHYVGTFQLEGGALVFHTFEEQAS